MDITDAVTEDQSTMSARKIEMVPLPMGSDEATIPGKSDMSLNMSTFPRADSVRESMKSNTSRTPLLNRGSSKGGSERAKSRTSLFRSASQIAADSQSKTFRYKKRFANTIFYSAEEREAVLRKAQQSPNPCHIILQGIISLATKLELEEKDKKKKKYQELFSVIDKDKGGTINVATELGETLIRLGLGIDASIMRDAINHVCNRRGRKPDGWYGMNLSTPIYNEIDLDEFQDVMYSLSHDDESELEHINKAWCVFSTIDQDKDSILSAEELWRACSDFHSRFTLDDCAQAVLNQFGEGGMTFEAFLRYTGCEGDMGDVLQAHLQKIHRDLEECLTTFRTFDLDGSGTIDFSETAQVMRAMGHRVTQPQLDEIFSLCDPHGAPPPQPRPARPRPPPPASPRPPERRDDDGRRLMGRGGGLGVGVRPGRRPR
jgi:Ca2+-binding EF-hand superfamily protein